MTGHHFFDPFRIFQRVLAGVTSPNISTESARQEWLGMDRTARQPDMGVRQSDSGRHGVMQWGFV